MASTTILKCRVAANLGTIAAISAPVLFGLGDMSQTYRGQLTLVASGGAVTSPTWVLEGSLDQGTTWFVIPPQTTLPLALTGQITGGHRAFGRLSIQRFRTQRLPLQIWRNCGYRVDRYNHLRPSGVRRKHERQVSKEIS